MLQTGLKYSFAVALVFLAIFAQAQGRPTRESRIDKSILRDNRMFAQNAAAPAPPEAAAEPAGKPMVGAPSFRAATKDDAAKIQAVDKRYQAARSVAMDLTKTLKISALGRERSSKGRVLTSKGRMRLEIDSPDHSLLVLDKKTAWLVNYPPEEFKGAALQVVKTSLNSKKARSQALVGLLAQGGILKHFTVTGVMPAQGSGASNVVYFLQPSKQLVEFTRAQARLTPDGKDLMELRYWDEIGNETALGFSNVRLNAPAPESSFQYVPPKDADVTTM